MTTGATVAHWSVILGQQGGLVAALDNGLEITEVTADDFLEAERQLMAGLDEVGVPNEELRALAQAAIEFKQLIATGGVLAEKPTTVTVDPKSTLRSLAKLHEKIDPTLFSQGVARAKQNHGFGLAAARLFASPEAAMQAVRETLGAQHPQESSEAQIPLLLKQRRGRENPAHFLKRIIEENDPEILRFIGHGNIWYGLEGLGKLRYFDPSIAARCLTYLLLGYYLTGGPNYRGAIRGLFSTYPTIANRSHIADLHFLIKEGPTDIEDGQPTMGWVLRFLQHTRPDLFEEQ